MAGYDAKWTVLTGGNNFGFYPIQIRLKMAEQLGEGSSSRRRLRCQIVVTLENKVNSYPTNSNPFKFFQGKLGFQVGVCLVSNCYFGRWRLKAKKTTNISITKII